jgi:TIR domain
MPFGASGSDGASADFFISYNRADRTWAEWIAWQLEAAGYTTVLQAWDFVPGSNFVLEMDKGARQAKRTIAVLSPSYLAASFPQPEWGSALAGDPTGAERKLVPVRVAECDPPGLLGQIVRIDLVGLGEEQARERLLEGMRERLKPSVAPAFPDAGDAGEASPAFPDAGDAGEASPSLPGEREQTRASTAPAPASPTAGPRTWVKIDDVITAVDELDDAGETITLRGRLEEETLRRLDALRQRGFGNPRVRFVSADRVADAELTQLRRTTRGGATETTIELTRAQPVRGNSMRAGTGGLTPDDLVEAGMREYFLGQPLPASLGILEHMADPGLDRDALARAFALDDPAARQVIRLLLVEALLGKGNAQALTRLELGPRQGGTRQIAVEWLEPRVYTNVEPKRRGIEGTWRLR